MGTITREEMLTALKSIDPFYIEMLQRIHPIFERCLSIKEAGAELAVGEETARRVWKKFLELYPMVAKTMKEYDNVLNIKRDNVRYPKRCGDLSSPFHTAGDEEKIFGEKIVEKF